MVSKSLAFVESNKIKEKVLSVRGQRVILDRDIAALYGVSTKRLNEQVKRNLKRFPQDFMFSLTENEKNEVVANCDHLVALKFSYKLPYAFTEHGVAMLSSILKSERAILVNIGIVRVFVKIREIAAANKEMIAGLNRIEEKIETHDKNTKALFEIIHGTSNMKLLSPSSPYSNIKTIRDIICSAEKYIYWIDKYFSKVGFDLIAETLNQKRVKNVRILMLKEKTDEKFLKMFKDLKKELKLKGVLVEIRLLSDKKLKADIHDRWIISENKIFNVPSTDTIARGQYSEVKETKNRPPFEKWWEKSSIYEL